MSTTEYVVRKEGTAGRFGLGEVIVPGVALFRSGFYNLTQEELDRKVASLKPASK
jgi:hypothetical protein